MSLSKDNALEQFPRLQREKKGDIYITFGLCLQKIPTQHVAGLLSKTSFLILYKDFTEHQYVLGELINFYCTHQRSTAMGKITIVPNKEIAGRKNRQWKPRHSIKTRETKESEID